MAEDAVGEEEDDKGEAACGRPLERPASCTTAAVRVRARDFSSPAVPPLCVAVSPSPVTHSLKCKKNFQR